MKRLFAPFLLFIIAACTLLGTTPEAQIVSGAEKLTATTNAATVLLERGKISVPAARSYREMIMAATTVLDGANATLLECRKATRSTSASVPDPCSKNVEADLNLVVTTLGQLETTLKAKE